ncbi:Os12g0423826 [Oryza sativa Japonica Group]|uniref:Os12g0423826 protein n=1 Tax=Oryza sativa subsp. japonica TaxID=39947 RepID=A0A0P0Y9G7_ORYSJ|nr:Os12g0423826 [Oryza sativa Japonica Group]
MVAVPNAELAAVPNDQCLWGFPSLQPFCSSNNNGERPFVKAPESAGHPSGGIRYPHQIERLIFSGEAQIGLGASKLAIRRSLSDQQEEQVAPLVGEEFAQRFRRLKHFLQVSTAALAAFVNEPSSLLCAAFLIEAVGLTPRAEFNGREGFNKNLAMRIGWPLRKDYITPNFYEIQDAH